MGMIMSLVVSAFAVFVSAYVLPGVHVKDIVTALVVAVVLGVLNMFLKPVLLVLTLPVTLLTLGLFALVINVIILYIVSALVPGFTFDNFWWALLFSIVLGLVNGFLHKIV